MRCDHNGKGPAQRVGEGGNLYALVIYLPCPLGGFLDNLRLEMVPGCSPHAHVSVLPPRLLPLTPEAAAAEARRVVADFQAFDIELGEIEIFPLTNVIFISVKNGAEQLREMHATLNQGALAYDEPFAYHPHVTLGQELEPGQVEPLLNLAKRRWQEFPGPRRFRTDRMVFVHNPRGDRWVDLAEEHLAEVGSPGRRAG
jgi:2'-5' RNA ligase superfamily